MNNEVFAAEKAKLSVTVDKIKHESAAADNDLAVLRQEYEQLKLSGQEEALPVAELKLISAEKRSENLHRSTSKPYFTRIDFAEKGSSAEQFYIGKFGVQDSDTLESVVYDWRAPVATLYYTGDMGAASFDAPYGKIEGELSLKRQFEIENGELVSVFDTDIVSQDAYLQRALSQMSAERLQDIVTTIQKEQYEIIRRPLRENLVIQGAAGSGKTTIALHRIAYLLYAYSDRLSSRNMLILAPNPLFLNYISGVLPDLGVENVNQSTFRLFVRSCFPFLPKKLPEAATASSHMRGSVKTAEMIDSFMDEYECSFVPQEDICFGPVRLYTPDEVRRFLLEDEAGFPMTVRLAAFRNQLRMRVKAAAGRLIAWYEKETERRKESLIAKVTSRTELSEKLKKLTAGCSARIEEVKAAADRFTGDCLSSLPSTDPMTVYRAFLESNKQLFEGHDTIDTRDIAPICLIAMRLIEIKKPPIRHVVIDEAQDLAPIEVYLLKNLLGEASFTIAGDLMQGITQCGGTDDWKHITDGVFRGRCGLMTLSTSYRSTRQIMNEAFEVGRRLGSDNSINVIRDGSPVKHAYYKNTKQRLQLIGEELEYLKSEGCSSVCVICRDSAEAKKLSRALPVLTLLDIADEKYTTGFITASAADVKGLEFDACIIADASAYGDGTFEGRLLYVALTRALHRLTVLSPEAPK